MSVTGVLSVVHVVAGFLALGAAVVAGASKVLDVAHHWHVFSGNVFFWAMVAIFATAMPLAVLQGSPFLLLIAILSFYFALAGWRYATYRRGRPRLIDWGTALTMLVASLVMVALGVYLLASSDSSGIVSLTLGAIGAALSVADLRRLMSGPAATSERIASHLTMMLAGAVSIVTAFLVVNLEIQPAYIAWLAPTVVLSPLIALLSRRVRSGRLPKGVREE